MSRISHRENHRPSPTEPAPSGSYSSPHIPEAFAEPREIPETLLGVDPAFDRAMILLDDLVEVLDGSMTTSPAKRPFLLKSRDGGDVDRRKIRIDDARLWMRKSAQSLAK